MHTVNRICVGAIAALFLLTASGCATYRAISEARPGSAKVFSGARLDVRALRGETAVTRRFTAPAPAHPALDLPFSFVLDMVFLPVTTSAALYEFVFY